MADWTEVAMLEGLTDRRPVRVDMSGEPVLLLKADDEIFAIGNQCTHQGAPLDKGVIRLAGSVRTVTCPVHGSMFRLEDGKVVRPPATKSIPAYDVKIEDGWILVRPRE